MRADARAVVDTNVLIGAALLAESIPARLLKHLSQQGRVLFSEATFAELEQRLWRPKLDRDVSPDTRRPLLHDLAAAAEWVPVRAAADRYSRDPDDDKFIHEAVAGRADALINGGGDLLALGTVHGIAILTAAQAWERMTARL